MKEPSKQGGAKDLDARIKLLIVIEAGVVVFFTGSTCALIAALLSSFAILCRFGYARTGCALSIAFAAVFALDFTLRLGAPHVPAAVLGILTFLALRMIPVFMLGIWLVRSIKVGDLIVSLERMNVPSVVTIPLAVTLRFIPTIGDEFRLIRNTMKLRGFALSLGSALRRPLLMSEYALVPLLMRCIAVADELAASALTRGLGSNPRRTSYRDVRLRARDWLWAGAYTLFALAVILPQKIPFA